MMHNRCMQSLQFSHFKVPVIQCCHSYSEQHIEVGTEQAEKHTCMLTIVPLTYISC